MSDKIIQLSDLEKVREKGLKSLYPERPQILVGMSSCGIGSGAIDVFWKIIDESVKHSLDVITSNTGCLGYCQKEPLVDVSIPGLPRVVYKEISLDKVEELISYVARSEIKKEWVLGSMDKVIHLLDGTEHAYTSSQNGMPLLYELPFYKTQMRIALRNCGFIKPDSLEEYIARGGYFALHKALKVLTKDCSSTSSGMALECGQNFLPFFAA